MGGEDVPGEGSGDPGDLLPLTPAALNVLLALADGERHGYGIMLEVRERTGGRGRLGPCTVYGGGKRPEGGGVIEGLAARSWRRRSRGSMAWCAPLAGRAPSPRRSRARRGRDGLPEGAAPERARTRRRGLESGLPVAPAGLPARASRRVRRGDGPPFSGPEPRRPGGRRWPGPGGAVGPHP